MSLSYIEKRFQIPDKSAKVPTRVFESIQSDMQLMRDSLTVLNVFMSPLGDVVSQVFDSQPTQPKTTDEEL